MSKDFKWDNSALKPSTITVDFTDLLPDKAPKTFAQGADAVVFREFSRTDLVSFIDESLSKQIYKPKLVDGVAATDTEGNEILERVPFIEVESDHSAFLFKYLAVSCRNAKDAEWFAKLDFTISGLTAIVDMLLVLNHVEEVLATQGNFMMLPTIRDLFAATAEKSSENPAPTLQV